MLEKGAICLIGFVSGTICTLLVRRMTDADKIRSALNSIAASLFEFRLFSDQPSVLLKAQWRLIAANARLLRLLAVPSLVLVLPYWGLLAGSEGLFGRLPLKAGESAVITVQCRNTGPAFSKIQLGASPSLKVETPAVRIRRDAQISWRVRALKPALGQLQVYVDGRTVSKSLSAAPGFRILSDQRSGTIWSFIAHPLELPILDPAVESIRVAYPSENLTWLIWFGVSSLAGALWPMFL
jgi:hypothetical protein